MGTLWRNVKIGGGGYVTGIDIAADGTIVCRTDTFGAYIWDPDAEEWNQLNKLHSMLDATVQAALGGSGVHELRIAPTNSRRLWMMYLGFVFRSDDQGLTWVNTHSYATVNNGNTYGNDTARFMGQKMAVDPANPDVVYIGTVDDGVYRTLDAGENWEQISTVDIPVCATTFGGVLPGHPGICFDPTSGTTGGRTNIIYLPVYGDAVYWSQDAGETWALTAASGPATVRHAKVGPDGIYYTVAVTSGAVHKFNGSAWTAITPGGVTDTESIVCDPDDANRVIAVSGGSTLRLSTNQGSSWGSALSPNRSSPDIPWLEWTNETFMSLGDMLFDGDGNIWCAHGIGVAVTPFSGSPSSVTWTYQTKGIENLTCNHVVIPPEGNPLLVGWDRSIFRVEDPEVYSSYHSPDRSFTAADVNTTDDTITIPDHGYPSNYRVRMYAYSGNTIPSPFTTMTTPYFVDVVDADTIKLSASSGPGAAVNISSAGTGTSWLIGASIRMAWHADWATSDPNFVAYNSFWDGNSTDPFGWYSEEGGAAGTWRPFSGFPSGGNIEVNPVGSSDRIGGCIAVSTPSNIIIVPSNNALPWYTKDGGATWTEIVIAGLPTSGETGFGTAYFNNHVCVAADRVTTGAFYLYNYISRRVYRSTDQGDTWTQMNGTQLPNTFVNQCRFAAVPGHEGHLWISGGLVGSKGDANPGASRVYRSTDSGATWSEVTAGGALREVTGLGFGAAAPSASYPSIGIAGFLDGTYGFYRSDDEGATWETLGQWPADWLVPARSMDGDKEVYGTWYAAIGGASYAYRTDDMPNRMVRFRLNLA